MQRALALVLGLGLLSFGCGDDGGDTDTTTVDSGTPVDGGPGPDLGGDEDGGIDEPDGGPGDAGPECTAAADCDDDNACTDDDCVEGACTNTDNTDACDDEDGCTYADTCDTGACVGVAADEDVVLFSGAALPSDEGWTLEGSTPVQSSDGSLYSFDTTTIESDNAMWHQAVDPDVLSAYDVEWRMSVSAGTWNPFDAGVAVMVGYEPPFGVSGQRDAMVYFTPTEIGWADESDSFALDATVPHTYRLSVAADGSVDLTVDDALALERDSLAFDGTIAFGDHTNDADVDGTFELDFIQLARKPLCLP